MITTLRKKLIRTGKKCLSWKVEQIFPRRLTNHCVRLILIQITNIISLLKTSVMRMYGYHSKVLGLIRGMVFTVSFQSAR